jgi:cell surface protein SprA
MLRTLVAALFVLVLGSRLSVHAHSANPFRFFQDTTGRGDTTRYPLQDRRGDPYTYPQRNAFDLRDTAFVKRRIEYDPVTKQYYVIETIGKQTYRAPMTFSMEEFKRLQGRNDETEYFRKRANTLFDLNRRNVKPNFGFNKDWMNRITGNGKVEIRPTGYVDILAGYQGQNIKNPTLPERARKTGGFDFNMNTQLQVDAVIGDKIRLPINYNTLANFDFENQLKLDYNGKDDEILKTFQAGNINFSSKGTLIPGAQSLFGVKTQLQFGKLFLTTVLANQRSQRESLGLQGGSASQAFNLKADEYEENRHFLLAHYFRRNYNKAMSQLPLIQSNVQILRVEVWVTNRTGATTDTRDVVALMDLGEDQPYRGDLFPGIPGALPDNGANPLYQTIKNAPNGRNSTQVQSVLTGLGLQQVQDFEKTFARKLYPGDYYFNPQIGFLSINQQLQPDEVVGVAYQYTYNGRVFQVGEFSQDIPPDSSGNSQNVLFLKLLKATSQRPNLPIWDLMMKNVYSVGYGQLERQNFKLDVMYEEPSFGQKRYLPVDEVRPEFKGLPILNLVNLDRLNNQNDPQPDGVFDYVEGFTVLSSQSRVIFPVLEPFGHDMDYVYADDSSRQKFLYYPLYDTIKAIAQTFANLNRFELVGRSQGVSNTDYQLGINIPRGSVTVTAGGQVLQENVDYEINYDLGTLRVINQAIINAGLPVEVQYENNASFGLLQRSYMALRLDYLMNKNLTLGGTIVRLGERPYFNKQSYGEDPIRNTMYGLDFDYRNNVPRLTRLLNKLPFYSTREVSSITAYGEAAMLKPGHAPQIGKGGEGVIYIDDFEGTRSSIDLRFPLINWSLASVPQKANAFKNGPELFPEAALQNNPASGFNRAKLAWYNIEPVLQERRNPNNPIKDLNELSKPETRQILQTEIFPQRTNDIGQGVLTTFDMAYYPAEKGPYNFRTDLDGDGRLNDPKQAWGGIMRNIDQTDFETANIEFIEFWLKDPFIADSTSTGGQLYFNLGNISEDVLRDGKRLFENGLPAPSNTNVPLDTSVWGVQPRNPIQVTNAFSNEVQDRASQDAGFDGLVNTDEQRKFAPYLQQLQSIYGSGPVFQRAQADPAGDDFIGYRDPVFDKGAGILQRYKNINNPQGNSPVASSSDEFSTAFTLYPDQEELNRDNTLNEVEEYFQYRVDLKPNMQVGTNFITDRRPVRVRLANNEVREESWYLFRIPVTEFYDKVGNIPDFKSIRFIRMFMTGFEDTTVLRFAKLELIRNQWRRFTFEIDTTGIYKPLPTSDPSSTEILAVNLEENDDRDPIPYVQPPGIERQQQISNNNIQLLINEQSLSLRTCNLQPQQSRGLFKTMNLDLRQYGRVSMFIHAESKDDPSATRTGDMTAVVRIGNDFVGNYYEVRIPLKKTRFYATDTASIWPAENNLDFDLSELTNLKIRRNRSGSSPSKYYGELHADGKTFAIMGNPNLGEVRGMMLAVQNTKDLPLCSEVWFNELRLSRLDEKGGWAALGRVDLKLADLGNLSFTGSARSRGFGTLEQKVNERSREDFVQFDVSTNLDLGKLAPKKAALQIPVYAGLSKTTSTPEYDPYDLDLKLKEKLDGAPKAQRDSIRADAVDELTIKTLNFTNVKKIKTNDKKPKPWDIENVDLNYSYLHQQRTNPIIENEEIRRTRAAVGYNFAPQPRFIEPVKGLIKSRSPWLALVRDINFNYLPSIISYKAEVFRQFGALRSRNVGSPMKLPETFDKYFYFDRYYTMRWDLTRSLTLDFNAVNNARIDEPFGRIDTKKEKDSVKSNLVRGGRTTRYHHDATLAYTVPTQKIPLLDWTTVRASVTAKYDWIAASLLTKNLGNTLLNGQTRNLTGEANFEQLYTKWKFLRAVYAGPVPQQARGDSAAAPSADTTAKAKKRRDPNALPTIGAVPRFLAQLATSVKRIGVQYTEDVGTLLPGYLDSTQFLGMNFRSHQPGWGYILGYQPDTTGINKLGAQGLLTRDSLFNQLIQQRYNQRLSITAQLSPIRDLNIDINLDKTYDKQYTELFKDTNSVSGLHRYNPYAMGSFSISYISYQTLFSEFDPNEVSQTFRQFEANRATLSQRLGKENIYAPDNPNADGFVEGYGRYAQDVLIPSFIAAYTGKDPQSVATVRSANPKLRSNPFAGFLPKPNWNITYNGLTRVPGMEKIFTNFTLRHGYSSSLSMNQFNTGLLFQDPFHVGFPYFIDTSSRNYVPYFLVPNVTIAEQFSPLIEADMTFTNGLSTRFEYRKSRQLSLSLIDYQLAENRSTEYTIGLNWRKRGVPFLQNVRIGKKGTKLDNDVTMRLDYSLRDDATANSKLDQNSTIGTAGQLVTRLAPSIDYVLNNRLNLKFYYERNSIKPKLGGTAPITTTRAGIQVRISLAQ